MGVIAMKDGLARKYRPYGQEYSTPPNLGAGYQGYSRDETSLDYAGRRFFDASVARFTAVDPSDSASPRYPGSWNRYAISEGDPVTSRTFKG
jgi:RHS repeat-associated protein